MGFNNIQIQRTLWIFQIYFRNFPLKYLVLPPKSSVVLAFKTGSVTLFRQYSNWIFTTACLYGYNHFCIIVSLDETISRLRFVLERLKLQYSLVHTKCATPENLVCVSVKGASVLSCFQDVRTVFVENCTQRPSPTGWLCATEANSGPLAWGVFSTETVNNPVVLVVW